MLSSKVEEGAPKKKGTEKKEKFMYKSDLQKRCYPYVSYTHHRDVANVYNAKLQQTSTAVQNNR